MGRGWSAEEPAYSVGTFVIQKKSQDRQFNHDKERWELDAREDRDRWQRQQEHEVENRSFSIRLETYQAYITKLNEAYGRLGSDRLVAAKAVSEFTYVHSTLMLVASTPIRNKAADMFGLVTTVYRADDRAAERDNNADDWARSSNAIESLMRDDLGIERE